MQTTPRRYKTITSTSPAKTGVHYTEALRWIPDQVGENGSRYGNPNTNPPP